MAIPAVISLRPYRADDGPALVEAALESVAEVGPFLPWCHAGLTLAEVQPWIDCQVAAFVARTQFEHVIVAANGRFLGGCGLNEIDPPRQRANLGYWVRTAATRRGVATAAVRRLVAWAFAETELVRLEVVVSTRNTASLRTALAAGATFEGVLRRRLPLHGVWHDAAMLSFVRGD